jgi:chromate transporter
LLLKSYFSLFKYTFAISAFTFGGGYVVIPMMRKYFVNNLQLITEQELLDMAAIAQSTPGAIAVNLAVLVGYRILGKKGAIISCIGTILPPLLLLSVISYFYASFRGNQAIASILRGMEAGVAAVIIVLVIDMTQGILKNRNTLISLMIPISFFLSFFMQINVVFIILGSSFLCFFQVYLAKRRAIE